MSTLQIWLQNHNRKMNQEAIDEALMEYIGMVEKQRDELLAALEAMLQNGSYYTATRNQARTAIARVKGGAE